MYGDFKKNYYYTRGTPYMRFKSSVKKYARCIFVDMPVSFFQKFTPFFAEKQLYNKYDIECLEWEITFLKARNEIVENICERLKREADDAKERLIAFEKLDRDALAERVEYKKKAAKKRPSAKKKKN
jgi:hypothetical protein